MGLFILLFFFHSYEIPESFTDWTRRLSNICKICWKGESFWWTKTQNIKSSFQTRRRFYFPKIYLHRCNRSCSLNYLNNLFVYSTSSDSVFYINCELICISLRTHLHLFVSQEKRKNLNTFVNVGFCDWRNVIERQSIHVEQKYHKDAIKESHNLIDCFEKPEGIIDYHSEAIYHETCSKCQTYLSPTSKYEMIEVIGQKIILRNTVEEINQASTVFCRRSNF